MTFGELAAAHARAFPTKTAVVDGIRRLTWSALDDLAGRAAAGLAGLGIGAGDVVSSLLPNRAEAAIFFHAARWLGAVWNPIVPILGAREIRFILRQAQTSVVIAPDRFRGVDYPALLGKIRAEVPVLRAMVVAGNAPAGAVAAESLLAGPARETPRSPRAAGEVALILYTSGTTAEPKGVLHSDATLLSLCERTVRYQRLSADEVFIIGSPVGHISGLLYAVLMPAVLGAGAVLMETWDPEEFLALVERERGTFSAGATPFLQSVVDSPHLDRYDLRSLRIFPCGGADVPPDLIRRTIERLRVRTGRGYGSTEFPSITSSSGPDVPDEKRATTDGAPVPPNEIELRDAEGRTVPAGSEGEIWAHGPARCLGYRDATLDREAFDERGFFCTGDLGVVDADGYLTITGRLKDIIVRSGEKFSAREIEDLLFGHPKVRSVAIVAIPDRVTGERACAFVVPARPDDPPTLDELCGFLSRFEISRRKLPERLELVEDLPVTASGKVQKHLLRERIVRAR